MAEVQQTSYQVAIGFDAAKKAVYDIMTRYFPKIGDSKSTLVNALVSGLALLYAMWQVFAKQTRAELYVSTARELESLYKLIPLVGVDLFEPVPMTIFASLKAQDDAITPDSAQEILYLIPDGTFQDGNSYQFYSRPIQHIKSQIFDFTTDSPTDPTKRLFVEGNIALCISVGRSLGERFVPLSIYLEDSIYIEFPYYKISTAQVRIARLKAAYAPGLIHYPFVDDGSDYPSDINLVLSKVDLMSGEFFLRIDPAGSGDYTFNSATLKGQPVNASWVVRPCYLKAEVVSDEPVTNFPVYSPGGFPSSSAYIYQNRSSNMPFGGSNTSYMRALQLRGVGGLGVGSRRSRIAPFSLKIKNGDITFDFSLCAKQSTKAIPDAVIQDPYWGTIYRTSCFNGAAYWYAYLLDEWSGLVFFECPNSGFVLDAFTAGFSTFGSKGAFDQYQLSIKSVNPPSDFNFERMSYILSTVDPVLFNQLQIKITDPGYEDLVFEQVRSVATVQGDALKAYFEVSILSPTRVEIRFGSSVDFASIQNLQVLNRTVKAIAEYKSGEGLSGATRLVYPDGSPYLHSGLDLFQFQATNLFGGSGPGGIPSIEGLRSLLSKSAYVLSRNVTVDAYAAAIEAFYVGEGKDARIKVFGYEDFGDLFIDSVNGNIVFFVGVVNSYINSDPILTVPSEADPSAQYTRKQLVTALPWLLTDFGPGANNIVLPVGRDPAEIDAIQVAIRDTSLMTAAILSAGSASTDLSFVQQFAVYFKMNLAPAQGFTFTAASLAVKAKIAEKFKWSTFAFVRDLNVSDIYRELDSLPEVDHILFTNLSHYRNDDLGSLKVMDIEYQIVLSGSGNPERPQWNFVDAVAPATDRKIKIDILGLGGIDIENY